jgi:hypothetical protein
MARKYRQSYGTPLNSLSSFRVSRTIQLDNDVGISKIYGECNHN